MSANDLSLYGEGGPALSGRSAEERIRILDSIYLDEVYTRAAARRARIADFGGQEAYNRIMAARVADKIRQDREYAKLDAARAAARR